MSEPDQTPPAEAAPPQPEPPLAPPAPAAAPSAEARPAVPELSPAACAARLGELFPALFGSDPLPRPIKLRIQADIQARAPGVFTRKTLSIFLHRHTTSTAYLKALVAAASRFDLDGAPAGEIADEHRQAAQLELQRRRALMIERRKAEAAATMASAKAAPDAAPGATAPGADTARPPRPPRPDRAQRRGPQASPEARRPEGPQAQRPRPPGAHPGPRDRAHRPDRPPRAEGAARAAAATSSRRPAESAEWPGAASSPEDAPRRERQALLRAWEASPLTKANFCVLKRIAEGEFDALIEQARRERDARRAPPAA